MNTKLLLRVKEQILKEPRLFDMLGWNIRTECGTAHCIGGWASVMSNNSAPKIALRLDGTQFLRLFFVSHWPIYYKSRYRKANKMRRAKVAARYIDYFIKKYDTPTA